MESGRRFSRFDRAICYFLCRIDSESSSNTVLAAASKLKEVAFTLDAVASDFLRWSHSETSLSIGVAAGFRAGVR